MKTKILNAMVALAIITAAALLWNSSYQVARILGADPHVVDVLAYAILGASFYPIGKVVEKKEDYV